MKVSAQLIRSLVRGIAYLDRKMRMGRRIRIFSSHSQWARSYYQQQRERGKGHHAAVRGLAFQWIRLVFCCWKDEVVYDENKYLAALAKRHSPLAAVVADITL